MSVHLPALTEGLPPPEQAGASPPCGEAAVGGIEAGAALVSDSNTTHRDCR